MIHDLVYNPKQNKWELDTKVILPNVRKFFIPDPGYTILDTDLDRADLQVVVWEANDTDLKDALRMGVDIHLMNGMSLENLDLPPLEELVESHPRYPTHRGRYGKLRQLAKSFIHGTNYGGSARTMGIAAKISTAQAQLLQDRWFNAHPGIKEWHDRTAMLLQTKRQAINRFGYRRVYLERPDALLPEALAWVPQSTVALYINMIWDKWMACDPNIEILMQVHDSLVFQYPTHLIKEAIPRLRSLAQTIAIPYPDPLVIPVGFKMSTESWGAVS
jgi:DNA polymerase I-like protein with 3'-5' exonuclease and polymerase domains